MLGGRSKFTRSCSPFRGVVASRGQVGAHKGLRQSEFLGAEAERRPSLSAMPPYSCLHSSRQLHPGLQAWLALASTAAYNRSLNADTQPAAARRPLRAGYLQR